MRTNFSSQNWLTKIRKSDINYIHSMLDHFMWDTSIQEMSQMGAPSDDDVHEWILCLQHREDKDTIDVQECIKNCQEFINGHNE